MVRILGYPEAKERREKLAVPRLTEEGFPTETKEDTTYLESTC